MPAEKSIPSFAKVPQPVIATRLTPAGIFLMIQDHYDPLEMKELWTSITHIVFEGFQVNESGIKVGCCSNTPTANPAIYTKWLSALQKRYKHLQIIWYMPPLASNCEALGGWPAVCEALVAFKTKKKFPIDGVVFDFSSEIDLRRGFFKSL